mmetsp:Transcript_3018/g.4911  ORF Transcript_3018/g.4911 Transcript_3018/m.4911 type:complete len:231 (+) Transcript_3018:2071-2763(+)
MKAGTLFHGTMTQIVQVCQHNTFEHVVAILQRSRDRGFEDALHLCFRPGSHVLAVSSLVKADLAHDPHPPPKLPFAPSALPLLPLCHFLVPLSPLPLFPLLLSQIAPTHPDSQASMQAIQNPDPSRPQLPRPRAVPTPAAIHLRRRPRRLMLVDPTSIHFVVLIFITRIIIIIIITIATTITIAIIASSKTIVLAQVSSPPFSGPQMNSGWKQGQRRFSPPASVIIAFIN